MLAFVALVALELLAELPAPHPPAPGAGGWTVVKTVDGVKLSRAPSERAAPWGAGDGEIAAPLDRVIAHLTDFSSLGKWMPRAADFKVIAQGEDEALIYFRFDLPWPISDRDWTLRYRWRREGDRFVMTWQDAHDRGPPLGKPVRPSPLRGYWELTATPSGTTRARYVFLAELGGSLPRSVTEQTAWKQPLGSFQGVRSATTSR
ncbi:MAG: phosphatidylcholine transfer protein [Myxococcales bacterium]|nr:phosphatidylcholine transfer protein [Myxococcales bacterium]